MGEAPANEVLAGAVASLVLNLQSAESAELFSIKGSEWPQKTLRLSSNDAENTRERKPHENPKS